MEVFSMSRYVRTPTTLHFPHSWSRVHGSKVSGSELAPTSVSRLWFNLDLGWTHRRRKMEEVSHEEKQRRQDDGSQEASGEAAWWERPREGP
jgi:hypothetical protein